MEIHNFFFLSFCMWVVFFSLLSLSSVFVVINLLHKWKQSKGTPAFNTQLLIFIIVSLFLFAQHSSVAYFVRCWINVRVCVCESKWVREIVCVRVFFFYIRFRSHAFEWNKRRLMKTKGKVLIFRFALFSLCGFFSVSSYAAFPLSLSFSRSISISCRSLSLSHKIVL